MGGGDAGAAVRADGGPVGGAERGEAAGEVGGGQEGPVLVHVLRGRGADRAGDVAGHRVDRLGLAAVPRPRPRVEQHARAGQRRGAVRVEEGQVPGRRGEITGGRGGRRQARLHRVTSRRPGREAAVEHPHLPVAEVPQQPPRAGRRRGVGVVVHHDRLAVPDAGPAHRGLEVRRGGHRVPAAGTRRGREVAVQVGEHRARDVPGPVQVDARRAAQPPADVEQRRRRRHRRGPGARQLGDGDEGAAVGRAAHGAAYVSIGTSCSAEVSEPCWPVNPLSCGSACEATIAVVPAAAATTLPILSITE